ncbi:lysophospholipid acyltransferase family protein [bacterium]|nr:lysophospholipid acyltransferase family protein [bacterium]
MKIAPEANPIKVQLKNPIAHFLMRKLTKMDDWAGIYDRWMQQHRRPDRNDPNKAQKFLDFALGDLRVQLELLNASGLDAVPRSGPLLIVANHPLGALEGMLLSQLLLNIRPDLKVLVNELLLKIPEFSDVFVGVDVFASSPQARNSSGLRTIHRHLAAGGASLIFPAGTVSVLDRKSNTIADAPWSPMIARLALKHDAHCLPLFVHGLNPPSFYWAGLLHKLLRTALLGRAMLSHRGKRIAVSVGAVIEPTELAAVANADAVIQYLRLCSDQLADNAAPAKATQALGAATLAVQQDVAIAQMVAQIESLASYQVAAHRDFAVYCAPYAALGCVMRQIAISRERTFREVSEGSGKELDQDRFDPFYWHLFAWDQKAQQLIGGYRLSKVDELVASKDINHLYSRSLYHYDLAFVQRMGKAIEVGRSFICSAYQRQPHALDLLWKGIGAFIVKNPGYHTLFGCVSISKEYSLLARKLLAETFLHHHGAHTSIRAAVRPSSPLSSKPPAWNTEFLAALVEIPILNKIVGRLSGGKSVPILIRHYLALNGKFVSFTVNHGFNESLDGLILVDLRLTPEKYINRYFGDEGAQAFRALHGVANAA